MLLRVSGQASGEDVDMAAVNGAVDEDSGVDHAVELVAFTEAVMSGDDARLSEARHTLREAISPEAFVDTCAVIGAFNVVDRIADSTGIPLDAPMEMMSGDLRGELDLARFRSAQNTLGWRTASPR